MPVADDPKPVRLATIPHSAGLLKLQTWANRVELIIIHEQHAFPTVVTLTPGCACALGSLLALTGHTITPQEQYRSAETKETAHE